MFDSLYTYIRAFRPRVIQRVHADLKEGGVGGGGKGEGLIDPDVQTKNKQKHRHQLSWDPFKNLEPLPQPRPSESSYDV